ncbi:DUF1697 domain-containing protein [Streptomyces caniscabiei]|uniref:DUF1697 domain-containing protein n=1 Tax=Streptomyces caniscabiei TaxID=2746961 RepID=UPI0029B88890|nr:DUF1697 domain-containing protein [Streptomyces caniscabiei]MDX2776498.1 DUF1697 domain-containing protein [Streptomyces caniscabiei]
MTKYVALLRGIAPTNPNMRNDKLRAVFESIGFTDVTSVISSGNILFETSMRNRVVIEQKIQQALYDTLDIEGITIIRSREDLQQLIDKDPFKGRRHDEASYLTVTFLKDKPKEPIVFPEKYPVIRVYDREVCAVSNQTRKDPNPALWLEKVYGKTITTRTWNTTLRLYAKLA